MFVDIATVRLKAGDGGNGVVSFRHEIYVDKGGPDGGDGGKGGDIILVASRNQNTLASFRYSKELKADPGGSGAKRRRHGRNGKTMRVAVPVGTVVYDKDGSELCDLGSDGLEAVVAKGGNGGFGNAHFTSSTRQTPRIAEKGEPGEELEVTLELKMIADVGLVGLPNAGKSTLLSVISNAKPEIANYAFTTLTPNLGVVDIDKTDSMLVADIPGLIEGAAEGKGLGDDFLRHVERTAVLIHLIDSYQDNVAEAYKTIEAELAAHKSNIHTKPQVVALTKTEGLDEEIIADRIADLKKVVPPKTEILAISAKSKAGIPELLRIVRDMVATERDKAAAAEEEDSEQGIPRLTLREDNAWRVSKQDGVWVVTGRKIEKFAARTDFENYHGIQRLRDIMRKMGIMHELERQDINPGDTIRTKYGDMDY
jgi:GTP-binding protein